MPDRSKLIRDALTLDLAQRCIALKEQAEKARHSEFASDAPGQFLGLLADIATTLLERLLPDSPTDNELDVTDSFVREVASHVRYAEAATSERIPWSLSEPLVAFARRFLGDGVMLLLRPQWAHNYSIIIDNPVTIYRDQLAAILGHRLQPGEGPLPTPFPYSRFHIVSFPALERMNLLLHCDLAHEVGHLVAEAFLDDPTADVDTFTRSFSEAIARHVDQEATRRNRKLRAQERSSKIQVILERAILIRRRALEELISDMFAALSFGPASLLALQSMVISRPLEEPPSADTGYYPPSGIRMRTMHDTLAAAELLPITLNEPSGSVSELQAGITIAMSDLTTFVNGFPSLLDSKMEVSGVSPDWLVQLAYDSVKTTMPAVQTYLAERHGDAFPKAKAIFSPASHLLERLLAGLPPNEFRSAENKPVVASLECMVNAAWLFRLGALQNLSENRQADERHIPNLATVNRLTLRAIELARVHAEYQVWEERQRGATDA